MRHGDAESAYAWARLFAALLLSTLGGVGMWSIIVALPAVQAEFGVARADASLPYTMTMIGFGLGGRVRRVDPPRSRSSGMCLPV